MSDKLEIAKKNYLARVAARKAEPSPAPASRHAPVYDQDFFDSLVILDSEEAATVQVCEGYATMKIIQITFDSDGYIAYGLGDDGECYSHEAELETPNEVAARLSADPRSSRNPQVKRRFWQAFAIDPPVDSTLTDSERLLTPRAEAAEAKLAEILNR